MSIFRASQRLLNTARGDAIPQGLEDAEIELMVELLRGRHETKWRDSRGHDPEHTVDYFGRRCAI